MKLSKIGSYGLSRLISVPKVTTALNLWATQNHLPPPFLTSVFDDVASYQTLVPDKLFLHKGFRLHGWGYKFPAMLQFKLEYMASGDRKTCRLPLW